MSLDQIAGVAHRPDWGHAPRGWESLPLAGAYPHPLAGDEPAGVVVLTHGAGGSRESTLLQRVCDEWAQRGWLAIRYNLPFRRRRPKGPPSGSGAGDRAGIIEAIGYARGLTGGPLVAGGHSYGGRQTSMVAATGETSPDLLMLFSYPVHPPGKPERTRTDHLGGIAVPTVFVHGSSDPFGTLAEVRAAAALISAPTEVVEIVGARHDLTSKTLDVPALAVAAALRLLG